MNKAELERKEYAEHQASMEKGMEKGAHNKAQQIAKELLKEKALSIQKIADITGLSLEDIQNLKE